MNFPDCRLLNDLIVFPQAVSRAFEIRMPDLDGALAGVLEQNGASWGNFLNQVGDEVRLQFQNGRNSDFSAVLDRYAKATAQVANPWSRRVREERHARYLERMRSGKMFRDQTVAFISVPAPHMPHLFSSPFGLEERYRKVLANAAQQIQRSAENLSRVLAPHSGFLIPFADADHHRYYAHFLNPSLARRTDFDPLDTFDPSRSVQANCWWSEAAGSDFDFYMDSNYHCIRVFSRLAPQLSSVSLRPLWKLPGGNYRVTMNVRPLSSRQLIERGERKLKRLEAQYQAERKPSLLPAIEKLRKRIEGLAAGILRPFAVEVLVHTWAPTREALATQCALAEQTIQSTGAQYFAPALPTTSKRLFAQTWPGHPWGPYTHYELQADSSFLPYLIPMPSTFMGYVDDAEGFFETPEGRPVGLRTTSGGQPRHLITIGGTGSGKSMWWQDFLSQIVPFFGFITIVDYGQSYETLVGLLDPGSQPLVLRANASFKINYLSTQGLPLTNEHLDDVAAVVSLMSGTAASDREERVRRAVTKDALRQIYHARFNKLEREHPDRAIALARHAIALRKRQSANCDTLDAFVDFRDWQAAHADEANAFLERIPERDAVAFLKDPVTRPDVVGLACATLAPHEEPIHRELQEWLRLKARATGEPFAEELAAVLQDWCGMWLDGASTVSMHRPVVCWEMGQLDEKSPALMNVGRYIVKASTWNQIYARPRSERKLVLFEETSAFLEVPGAEALLRRAYEQARKFNTVIATVFQSYSRLLQLPIRASLMGSTQQFILLKQDDDADLIHLVDDLGLPTSFMEAIKQFPRPADAGRAHFAMLGRETPHPVVGVGVHVPSAEMHYVTNSTPSQVEARRAAFRQVSDPLAHVQQAAAKP